MDSPEENGTIIVDNEEEFWLLQVMAISEVDSGRREDCFGFKKFCPVKAEYYWEKELDLSMREMLLKCLASNLGNDWSKIKKTGKGLQKLGQNLEALISQRKACLTNLKWAFGCDSTVIGRVQRNA